MYQYTCTVRISSTCFEYVPSFWTRKCQYTGTVPVHMYGTYFEYMIMYSSTCIRVHSGQESAAAPALSCPPGQESGQESPESRETCTAERHQHSRKLRRLSAPDRLSFVVFLGLPVFFFLAFSFSVKGEAGEQFTPRSRCFASSFSFSRARMRLSSSLSRCFSRLHKP